MKKIGIALLFALLANFVSAEVAKTINNLVAGTLSTVLTAAEKATVTKLTVTGNIDVRDFNCMRDEMTVLADVDLKETQIVANTALGSVAGEIPKNAFSKDFGFVALKSFVFPKWAESVGDGAFKNCTSLTSIKLDSCIYTVGIEAFAGCTGLTSITLSDCLNSIKPRAFAGCTSLSGTLIVPNSVQKIKDAAFSNCIKLNGVVFGSQVDSVGAEAFDHCSELKTIRFTSYSKTKLSIYTFYYISSGATIYVPVGTLSNYSNDTSWQSGTALYEYKARVSSQSAIKQTTTSVKFTGSIDFITDEPIISYGFCWSKTSTTPTMMDALIDNGTTTTLGNFYSIVNTLTPGTAYNIRAFVYDRYGASYGKLIKYTTPIMPSAAGQIVGKDSVVQGMNEVYYSVPVITNATSYVWTLPNGTTQISSSNWLYVSFDKNAVSGTISVFGRNANGDGTASSKYINVYPLPKPAGQIVGNTVVCQGEKRLTYTVPPIENATSYVWRLPQGCTGISSTNTILLTYSVFNSVSGHIAVYGKNAYGNGDSSTLAVTVHQVPNVEYYEVALEYGGSMTLAPKILYTDGGTLKYKWFPSTGLSNDTIANPVVTVNSTIQYTLTVTTPYGCTTNRSIRVSLKAMDKPVIGIVGIVNSKNRIAWNKPVSQGIASYLIYKETIVSDVYEKIGTVPYDSLSVYVDASSLPDVKSSKYKISVLDKSGIESPSSDPHKTIHLAINKGQNNSWNLIWEAYEGFKPSTYNIYRGTSPTSLNFLDATSASSTQYSDLEAPSGNVYYQLEVISPNLVNPTKAPSQLRSVTATYNSSRSNVAAGIVNGLDETKSVLSIYPNPVKDVLNIEMEGGSSFEILNLTGQLVVRGDLKENTVVNTGSYKPGMYVVKVKVANGFVFRKIIKE